MNVVINIGWKFVVGIGLAASMIILAAKLDPNAAERVSEHVADAFKDAQIAIHGHG